MSDQIDLEAIMARCEAATEGPWEADSDGVVFEDKTIERDKVVRCYRLRGLHRNNFMPTMGNAQFVAHAREDVPKLVEEVEVLRKENTAYEIQRQEFNDLWNLQEEQISVCGKRIAVLKAKNELQQSRLAALEADINSGLIRETNLNALVVKQQISLEMMKGSDDNVSGG